MPKKFAKQFARGRGYLVKFGKGGLLSRGYRDAEFAILRAFRESKEYAAFVKHRGSIIAVFQRGRGGL